MSQAIPAASTPAALLVRPTTPGGTGGAPAAPTEQPPASAAAPNPRLSLDAATGLVVMEFRSSGGMESLPTPRELTAYKLAVLSGGERPAGIGGPGVRTTVGD